MGWGKKLLDFSSVLVTPSVFLSLQDAQKVEERCEEERQGSLKNTM